MRLSLGRGAVPAGDGGFSGVGFSLRVGVCGPITVKLCPFVMELARERGMWIAC